VTSIDLTVVYSLGAVFLGNGSLVVNFLNDSLVDNEYWLCEIHIIRPSRTSVSGALVYCLRRLEPLPRAFSYGFSVQAVEDFMTE
jgi:hypothetical protein